MSLSWRATKPNSSWNRAGSPCREALEANRAVRAGGVGVMRWLDREIQVLSHLADL